MDGGAGDGGGMNGFVADACCRSMGDRLTFAISSMKYDLFAGCLALG
jgi:hypothetical protein